MSLVTQCPFCATTFKVVRDQLKISDGWVRCGQCSEIFDSAPNLRDIDLDPPPPAPGVNSVPSGGGDAGSDSEIPQEPKENAADVEIPVPSAGPTTQDFSFIAKSEQSVWRSRPVRALTASTCVIVMLVLVAQLVHGERDRLAAMDVRWRNALLQVCEHIGCEIHPWRQIESIAVESSGFHKLRFDTYRLNFVVTNSADVSLARPALELTLTDSQDLPLLRRVLMPAELDVGQASVAAHGEWAGSHVVSIAAPSASLAKSIAGYRLLAFYP